MKKIQLVFAFALTSAMGVAQQMPQYSQYLRNQFMINPAAAGVYDFADFTVSGRWQWAGFDNSPKTAYASGTFVLGKKRTEVYNPGLRTSMGPFKNPEVNTGRLKHALGGQVVADQYGAFQRMNASATYALHLPLSQRINLAFGTKVGLSNNTFLQDRAVPINAGNDNTYQSYIGNQSNLYSLDIGAGFYLYSKRFFAGISADQLTGDLVEFGTGTPVFDKKIHFLLTAGYKFQLNEKWTLTPAALAKFMYPVLPSYEGSLQAEYDEWLWFGASYRHEDAVVGMVGMNINRKLKFGYSFDFATTRYRTYRSGGHELVLGFMLGR